VFEAMRQPAAAHGALRESLALLERAGLDEQHEKVRRTKDVLARLSARPAS